MTLTLLHTADLHGSMTEEIRDRLLVLRERADFYFDCGDAVKAGNVGVPTSPDPVWTYFRDLRCTAGVPGNREFHVSSSVFRKKLHGCSHPLLAANLHWNGRARRPLLPNSEGDFYWPKGNALPAAKVLGEIGLFGVMVPMVRERMAARFVSAFVNTDPVEAARDCVEWLRPRCRLVIGLSHIGLREDVRLLEQVKGIDILLGGHSHDLLDEPLRVGDGWLMHVGSHAFQAGLHEYRNGTLTTHLETLRSRR